MNQNFKNKVFNPINLLQNSTIINNHFNHSQIQSILLAFHFFVVFSASTISKSAWDIKVSPESSLSDRVNSSSPCGTF